MKAVTEKKFKTLQLRMQENLLLKKVQMLKEMQLELKEPKEQMVLLKVAMVLKEEMVIRNSLRTLE